MSQQSLFADSWTWRGFSGTASARFSPCEECGGEPACICGVRRRFRYELRRTWDPSLRPLVAICCNPSTADSSVDDATCRRLYGFADRWGLGGLILLNAYAFRSTDPGALRLAHRNGINPVGPDNDRTLRTVLEQHKASRLLIAWGGNARFLDRGRDVVAMAMAIHGRPECFGLTDNGHPWHPLYIPDVAATHLYADLVRDRARSRAH